MFGGGDLLGMRRMPLGALSLFAVFCDGAPIWESRHVFAQKT
jgi:hypothetical protein